ncbi:uncharacterized protein C2orf50 homolog [Antennarius striatus]|uniref:uncharacterized protein C2orf50 homolog n=1 Tax=Antennarius striatus TaxID=241820 RepID=UPI0035ADB1C9
MDLNGERRVSSAGYRLPERNNVTRPVTSAPRAEKTRRAQVDAPRKELNPDVGDAVKRDQAWKDLVVSERRGVREWEKNWGFLRNYDHMGQLKQEEPQINHLSLCSDRIPKTSNQTFGRRLSTPLGSEVVRLDRLLLLSGHYQKLKSDPEMLPC